MSVPTLPLRPTRAGPVLDADNLEARLRCVLDRTRLPRGAIIDGAGEVVLRIGDFSAEHELEASVLGPYGSPMGTFELAEDDHLPTLFVQGRRFVYLLKPRADLVIALFGADGRPVPEKVSAGRWIRECVAAHFAPPPGPR